MTAPIRRVIYPCPTCGTEYTMAIVARACCVPAPAEVAVWCCPVCMDAWDTEEEAGACGASHPPLNGPEPITREAVAAEKKRVRPVTEEDEPEEDIASA